MTSSSHILNDMNTLNFIVIYWPVLVYLRIFHGSTVVPFIGRRFRAAPKQLEVETKLGTPGKSGRGRSSSSTRRPLPNTRAGDRGLVITRSELHDFQDSMKEELEDVKAMVKQLL